MHFLLFPGLFPISWNLHHLEIYFFSVTAVSWNYLNYSFRHIYNNYCQNIQWEMFLLDLSKILAKSLNPTMLASSASAIHCPLSASTYISTLNTATAQQITPIKRSDLKVWPATPFRRVPSDYIK